VSAEVTVTDRRRDVMAWLMVMAAADGIDHPGAKMVAREARLSIEMWTVDAVCRVLGHVAAHDYEAAQAEFRLVETLTEAVRDFDDRRAAWRDMDRWADDGGPA
jgi:hypothetical protein